MIDYALHLLKQFSLVCDPINDSAYIFSPIMLDLHWPQRLCQNMLSDIILLVWFPHMIPMILKNWFMDKSNKYIRFIQWEGKQMIAFSDWTPFFWVDEMARNFLQRNRYCPRTESTKCWFYLLRCENEDVLVPFISQYQNI